MRVLNSVCVMMNKTFFLTVSIGFFGACFLSAPSYSMSCQSHLEPAGEYDIQQVLSQIMTGTLEFSSLSLCMEGINAAQRILLPALNRNDWKEVAENSLLGSFVENPTSLVGEVIAGIHRHQGHLETPQYFLTVFAGKVIELKNTAKEGDRPFYQAVVLGKNGVSLVNITDVFSLHLLKRTVHKKLTQIAAVDELPTGERKFFDSKLFKTGFQVAQRELIQAVGSKAWKKWDPDHVSSVIGRWVTGVNQHFGNYKNDLTVTVFAGKVLSIRNIAGSGEKPSYIAEISGHFGRQTVDLTGAQALHILSESF